MNHKTVWVLEDRPGRGHVNGIDNADRHCTIIPQSAMCTKCRSLRQDRYPISPPEVGLFLECDVLNFVGLDMFMLNKVLLEAIKPWLTNPVITRCHSVPSSPQKNGDDYFVVALPREHYTMYREPIRDDVARCSECSQYTGAPTIGAYFYLTPAQHELSVWVSNDWNLLVCDEVKRKIDDKLKQFPHRWEKWPVRDEPLPHHRIPEDGLGPAEPPPTKRVAELSPSRPKSRSKPQTPTRTPQPRSKKPPDTL